MNPLGVFVQAGVGEVVEDQQLGILDAFGEGWGEAGRGDEVPAAVGDLGGGDDAPSWASASWARTASDWQEGVDGLGWAAADEVLQPATNSGFSAYISGVKHHGKMPWITMSGTLPRARAMTCQPFTTTARNGSVFAQALWSDSEATRSGYLAASHIPTAAPNDTPTTCARSMSRASMSPATSSANCSIEYGPAGLSVSPRPEVDRHAREVLGVLGRLEGVAGVVGGEVGNEDERLPGSLRLVVHRNVPDGRGRHGDSLPVPGRELGGLSGSPR